MKEREKCNVPPRAVEAKLKMTRCVDQMSNEARAVAQLALNQAAELCGDLKPWGETDAICKVLFL